MPDLLAFLGNRSQRGRNEEKWFPRKKCCGPLANPTSLAASRRTGSAGRHEEKWFPFPKKVSHLWWSLTPGRPVDEPKGMRKSGSAKNKCTGSLLVAELEGLPDGRDMAVFTRDRDVEKPAE